MLRRRKNSWLLWRKKIHEQQSEMNRRLRVTLRFAWFLGWRRGLPVHQHQPPPTLATVLPEETPERKLQFSQATLERYRTLREQRINCVDQGEQEEAVSLLEQLEKEMDLEEEEDKERGEDGSSTVSAVTRYDQETQVELSELEVELQMDDKIRQLHEQNCLLQQMETSVCQFDTDLLQLHRHKLHLDSQLKQDDLQLLTLFQEMLLLKQFEKREGELQERLNVCIQEEKNISRRYLPS
ncbi:cilia- and flagella-associated protein 44-like isoform X2 [Girardinichthys multiradiatus]|uniref:cilia- and flagella-associated protein 44-like isoform X2 n=1 Tax=Girardinichthys multiradiatus TaxID=208333 RepID=UPI001FAE2B3E|nr:cilia- and flagella-associated protein 44-like isoform X2 [Girardinichthys multiradiatus]